MKTRPPADGLTFEWPESEGFPLVLFGCVFLSLLAHVATFFVFQVVYPQHVTIPPPPPQVSLLTASSPENEALLRWIAAEDPALVASARSVLPPHLLDVRYHPSFEIQRTRPRGGVEDPVPVHYPPARYPLSLIRNAGSHAAVVSPVIAPARTVVAFAPALAARAPQLTPAFTWSPRATDPLDTLRALLGVTDRGEVRFAFVQQSSGNSELDAQALAQLGRLSFASGSGAISWGFANVDFGADAYAEPTKVSPSQPAAE